MEENKPTIEKTPPTIFKEVNEIEVIEPFIETGKEEQKSNYADLKEKLTSCRITLETCLHFSIPEQMKSLIEKTLRETC